MIKNIKAGDIIYVIERDENGEVEDYSGYMFLAKVAHGVIVTTFIDNLTAVDETVDYHIKQTAVFYGTDLCIFPECDCFEAQMEAEEIVKKALLEER